MARLFTKRRDLDAWASALGASNDDEAAAASIKLLNQFAGMHAQIRATAQLLSAVPDADLGRSLATVLKGLEGACSAANAAVCSFANHERG